MASPLVVAITGASGVVYGVRTLELLREVPDVETHLLLTQGARLTLRYEMERTAEEVKALADVTYRVGDLGAALSSGSFRTVGMLIIPCSIKTLSAIATSYSDNLVVRAADVTLKERRPLVLAVREAPLHAGHLRLLAQVTEAGAVVVPPVPAFYTRPKTIDDIVTHTVGRCLDLFGIETPFRRWTGAPVDDG
jgi:flavin prenyltransferase